VRLNGSQGGAVERPFGSMMKYVMCLGNILRSYGTAAFWNEISAVTSHILSGFILSYISKIWNECYPRETVLSS